MITYDEAFRRVMLYTNDFGEETVSLLDSTNRVLAESIHADRDFPPFDRSTKDGIAINYATFEKGINAFKIEGVLPAGIPQQKLSDINNCFEIMTGAVLPANTDTVVMYEDIEIKDDIATIKSVSNEGQNIHFKGSDKKEGVTLLDKGTLITAAEIGILASVGKITVLVKKLPKICVISTGDELVPVSIKPLPHQIRTSNVISLQAALLKENIIADHLHITDNKKVLEDRVSKAIDEYDILLLSGGVSKGKFDFIPEVLEDLGVEKIFHKVLQRPGKPFWFGVHEVSKTAVFSFPGNPVSTFVNYHIYFKPWFKNSMGLFYSDKYVILENEIKIQSSLTLFLPVKIKWVEGKLLANKIENNGSGDLTCLTEADGFICLTPKDLAYKEGALVPFFATKHTC
ncbi:molybdopterin molybdotransferase MoeA [Cellulophaga sp. HaHaR_3_176]|uniref:molybdopterin molybdotransferase MoeA n=1 Tax=Cellulophaga sp. HaHaR_3_176 TaxID=1942464 RepID=UPI001C1FA6D6|nr:molybdopterin molybdotransferase MoeA [Cellulophaga sp. HaHaR_3_176]QWX82495.1 molybdopterin molybdotransferase MoeA [Cellulophaga sp. HaHaR_3_176]